MLGKLEGTRERCSCFPVLGSVAIRYAALRICLRRIELVTECVWNNSSKSKIGSSCDVHRPP